MLPTNFSSTFNIGGFTGGTFSQPNFNAQPGFYASPQHHQQQSQFLQYGQPQGIQFQLARPINNPQQQPQGVQFQPARSINNPQQQPQGIQFQPARSINNPQQQQQPQGVQFQPARSVSNPQQPSTQFTNPVLPHQISDYDRGLPSYRLLDEKHARREKYFPKFGEDNRPRVRKEIERLLNVNALPSPGQESSPLAVEDMEVKKLRPVLPITGYPPTVQSAALSTVAHPVDVKLKRNDKTDNTVNPSTIITSDKVPMTML